MRQLNVKELEKKLEKYHDSRGWIEAQKWFAKGFGDNVYDTMIFLEDIMYTPAPLTSENAKKRKIETFHILQGDIIKTKSAQVPIPARYEFNQLDYHYYVVIPRSCAIQPRKFKQIHLARLIPLNDSFIQKHNLKQFLGSTLELNTTRSFYFPSIDNVNEGERGFLLNFDEISFIENSLLQSASRIASLSKIGWHLFNAFLANSYTAPSGDDLDLREIELSEVWESE